MPHPSTRRVLTLAITCTALFVTAQIVRTTPTAYIRVNLVLHGCAFCQTVESTANIDIGNRPHTFVAMYVLRNGEYAGYITPYGEFIARDTSEPLSAESGADLRFALIFTQAVCSIGIIGTLAMYLVRCLGRSQSEPHRTGGNRSR
jgi:hypothetical protein